MTILKHQFLAAALLLPVALAACRGRSKTPSEIAADSTIIENLPTAEVIYSGIITAQDSSGIRYTVALDYDKEGGSPTGKYELVQTYLFDSIDSAEGQTYETEGRFTIARRGAVCFLRLDPPTASGEEVLYFLTEPDGSSLTLTDSTLIVPDTPGIRRKLTL